MKQFLPAFFFAVAIMFLTGCSGLKVIPQPVENGVVNLTERSQTITRNSVIITARNAELEYGAYNLDTFVTTFAVLIENRSDREVSFDQESFLLIDDKGMQHFPLTPEKVKELLSRDAYYLLPYPYVGFYYLEDYEKVNFYNSFNSTQPFFLEMNRKDIQAKALSGGSIIPQAQVAGLVYFKINLAEHKSCKLLVYRKGADRSAPAEFTFPFAIQ